MGHKLIRWRGYIEFSLSSLEMARISLITTISTMVWTSYIPIAMLDEVQSTHSDSHMIIISGSKHIQLVRVSNIIFTINLGVAKNHITNRAKISLVIQMSQNAFTRFLDYKGTNKNIFKILKTRFKGFWIFKT